MKSTKIAVVVPAGPAVDGKRLRMEVWARVTELMKRDLGKFYTRFNPAAEAWGTKINGELGIVLGREEPIEFMDLFVSAKKAQDAAMCFHIGALLKEFGTPVKVDGALVQTVVINGQNAGQLIHALWVVMAQDGTILPDFGVFYAKQNKAMISEADEKDLVAHIADYAISVVDLAVREDEDASL